MFNTDQRAYVIACRAQLQQIAASYNVLGAYCDSMESRCTEGCRCNAQGAIFQCLQGLMSGV